MIYIYVKMAMLKMSSLIKNILKCKFRCTEIDEPSEVNKNNDGTSNQPTVRENVQINTSTNAEPSGSHQGLNGNTLSHNQDLIYFENEGQYFQRPPTPVISISKKVSTKGSQTQSKEIFYRTSQRQVASDNLSKTFKEYVQIQLDNLADETRSFNGTINNNEFKRLQKRIYRQLEMFENMDINDQILLREWKSQVSELVKELTYNATRREERFDIQNPIASSEIKTINTITPIHRPVPVHHNRNIVSIQKEEDDINARKLKIKEEFDNVHEKLTFLSKGVFNFCNYLENSEYCSLETNINNQLISLQSIEITDLPEFRARKFEIEQFGSTWLGELHRRLEEMKIRKYEARIKALW